MADMRYRTWASSGLDGLPKATRPIGEKEEKDCICLLISELRSGLAIDLDPTPSFERGVAALVVGDDGELTVVVGSSQAVQLHDAMKSAGMNTCLVEIPNWRITKVEVDTLLNRLNEALKNKKVGAVVFQFMDNTIYTALTEDGNKTPPTLVDGVSHMVGDLTVCDRSVLNKLLKLCMPLLAATEGIKTVLVGPLPRYVTGSCCQDPEHMPNRLRARFLEDLVADLDDVHKCARDFLFVEGLRNMRVMNPWVGLRGSSPANIWGEDPVHVKQEMQMKLVEGVKLTLNKITLKRGSDSREPEPKRSRNTGGGGADRGGGANGGSRSAGPSYGGNRGGGHYGYRAAGAHHRVSGRGGRGGAGGGGGGSRYRN
jgi:hypothetical protein